MLCGYCCSILFTKTLWSLYTSLFCCSQLSSSSGFKPATQPSRRTFRMNLAFLKVSSVHLSLLRHRRNAKYDRALHCNNRLGHLSPKQTQTHLLHLRHHRNRINNYYVGNVHLPETVLSFLLHWHDWLGLRKGNLHVSLSSHVWKFLTAWWRWWGEKRD